MSFLLWNNGNRKWWPGLFFCFVFVFNVLRYWQAYDRLPISSPTILPIMNLKKIWTPITFHLGLQKHFYQFSPAYLKTFKNKSLLFCSFTQCWIAILGGKFLFFRVEPKFVFLPRPTITSMFGFSLSPRIIHPSEKWAKQKKTIAWRHQTSKVAKSWRLERSYDGQFHM